MCGQADDPSAITTNEAADLSGWMVLTEFLRNAEVELKVTIKLNGVPGYGYHGEDFLRFVQNILSENLFQYKPRVEITKNDRPIGS